MSTFFNVVAVVSVFALLYWVTPKSIDSGIWVWRKLGVTTSSFLRRGSIIFVRAFLVLACIYFCVVIVAAD